MTSNGPHLTPEKLVGSRFSRETFGDIRVALVGYCPPPERLARYHPKTTTEQYFIHVTPLSVQVCRWQDMPFLSICHVYGGPVSAALIEELRYYGIQYVLAYGLAGGLGTKGLKMGDFYLVETALVKDGTTPHYTSASKVSSASELNHRILELTNTCGQMPRPIPVQAVTADAIYQERDMELQEYVVQGSDVINCDSSHLFAVSEKVGVSTTQCGVISDVMGGDTVEWDSTLSAMLSSSGSSDTNPLTLTGKIVEFYVEQLMPDLVGRCGDRKGSYRADRMPAIGVAF